MTTPAKRTEAADALNPGVGAPLGNEPAESPGCAEEQPGAARRNDIQIAERTAPVRDPARGDDEHVTPGDSALLAEIGSYEAFEVDFRAHHQIDPARSRGPYEHYRLVYRYGYDLGVDARYRNADWPDVERDARPRWEERNPNTWAEFKEMIQYAWNTARSQHS